MLNDRKQALLPLVGRLIDTVLRKDICQFQVRMTSQFGGYEFPGIGDGRMCRHAPEQLAPFGVIDGRDVDPFSAQRFDFLREEEAGGSQIRCDLFDDQIDQPSTAAPNQEVDIVPRHSSITVPLLANPGRFGQRGRQILNAVTQDRAAEGCRCPDTFDRDRAGCAQIALSRRRKVAESHGEHPPWRRRTSIEFPRPRTRYPDRFPR